MEEIRVLIVAIYIDATLTGTAIVVASAAVDEDVGDGALGRAAVVVVAISYQPLDGGEGRALAAAAATIIITIAAHNHRLRFWLCMRRGGGEARHLCG